MSSIPEKTEAARRKEEERMEIERGVKLLDTSMEDTTAQDRKRSRVDSPLLPLCQNMQVGISRRF